MSDLKIDVSAGDHHRGPLDASVVLVAYNDFECSDSAEGYLAVKQLLQAFGENICYIYRNYPLTDIHPLALTGARFAEASDKQGLYWQFHDFLYENQYLLEHPHRLLDEATKLGLDIEWIRREAAEGAVDGKIQSDISGGKLSGVTGTPTYFLNGRRHTGDGTVSDLFSEVEAEFGQDG